MGFLWFLVLVVALMVASEVKLYFKMKNNKSTIKIKYQDEGDKKVRRALELLNESRKTAEINK